MPLVQISCTRVNMPLLQKVRCLVVYSEDHLTLVATANQSIAEHTNVAMKAAIPPYTGAARSAVPCQETFVRDQ